MNEVSGEREHVYEMQHLVTAETRDVHVTCLQFFAYKDLEVTKGVEDIFEHLNQQAQNHIDHIIDSKKAERGHEFIIRVAWQGLDEGESLWERLSRVLEDAPIVLCSSVDHSTWRRVSSERAGALSVESVSDSLMFLRLIGVWS